MKIMSKKVKRMKKTYPFDVEHVLKVLKLIIEVRVAVFAVH